MKKKNKAVYSAMDIAAYILLALNDKDIHINYLHLERWMYFVQSYCFFLYDVPLFQDRQNNVYRTLEAATAAARRRPLLDVCC